MSNWLRQRVTTKKCLDHFKYILTYYLPTILIEFTYQSIRATGTVPIQVKYNFLNFLKVTISFLMKLIFIVLHCLCCNFLFFLQPGALTILYSVKLKLLPSSFYNVMKKSCSSVPFLKPIKISLLLLEFFFKVQVFLVFCLSSLKYFSIFCIRILFIQLLFNFNNVFPNH